MLARSLMRVPSRAIARQSLGKSTVRFHHLDRPLTSFEEPNCFNGPASIFEAIFD